MEEALAHGAQVTEVELFDGTTRFRLTKDFKLKAIDCSEPADSKDFTHLELWKHEAEVQTLAVAAVINALCKALDFKDPAEEAQQEKAGEEAFA